MISGHNFVSTSNISCSISIVNNASHGVVADGVARKPVCCEPPRNGMNVVETLGLHSLCV